jgi:Fur family transcriptional regulator, ferric uptake regulator
MLQAVATTLSSASGTLAPHPRINDQTGDRLGSSATRIWPSARDLLHARGLRWTPQRQTVLEVLAGVDGHIAGVDLVSRCRAVDPTTTPSTVYRTLDVLESLGLIRHGHGADGREEFHVLPEREHGHLHCTDCGATWDLDGADATIVVEGLRRTRGFDADLSHVTVVGRCAECRAAADSPVAL